MDTINLHDAKSNDSNKPTIDECISYRNKLKEKFTTELNTLNHYYWPIIASHKRRLKTAGTFIAIATSTLIVLSVVALLVEYDISFRLGLVGFGLILTALAIFFYVKYHRYFKHDDDTWQDSIKQLDPLREQIFTLENVICTDIITAVTQERCNNQLQSNPDAILDYFEQTKEELKREVGLTSDDLIEYYRTWVEE